MTNGTAISEQQFHRSGPVEVAVVTVTYNSSSHLDGLIHSLRCQTRDATMRVIVADNSSSDGSLENASSHADIIAVPTGGNLGYSGGINAAMEQVGDAEAILVLNPDLRVEQGAVASLLRRLRSRTAIGMVVPLITDPEGDRADSVFNEPGVVRSFADAVLGPLWTSRPSSLSEWVRDPEAYRTAHQIDWATGAAMLIAADTASLVGEWDERFFLYSEEIDYCRRVRELGKQIWFEPSAVVQHAQGASGQSPALDALLHVNRVRYMRKHAPGKAELYRRTAIVNSRLRAGRSASHRETLRYLRDESLWPELPHAEWQDAPGSTRPVASVVIPAHNEAAVISRTLSWLAEPARTGVLEVVVCCNGCADDTAARAAKFEGVRVVELSEASKTAALNFGDRVATAWPRIYLDADVELPAAAVPALVRALKKPGVLAGRPPFTYDTEGAARLVRAYYRARRRIPSLSTALWGAGVYVLTEAGHERLGEFPGITADDLYVDGLFTSEEKEIPHTLPALVRTPRTVDGLLNVLTRGRRGASSQGTDTGRDTLVGLLMTMRGPFSLWDAAVFVVVTLRARRKARQASGDGTTDVWERDQSSRTPAQMMGADDHAH